MYEEQFILNLVNNIYDSSNKLEFSRQIDLEIIKKISLKQKIFPVVYEFLKNQLSKNQLTLFEKEKNACRTKGMLALFQIKQISNVFENNGIKFVISKGVALATHLYEDPLLRNNNDIDIVVKTADFFKACTLLEQLGYEEFCLGNIRKYSHKLINKANYYAANSSNCKFIKKGFIKIELKDEIFHIDSEDISKWIDNSLNSTIENISFPTFSFEGIFINTLVNSQKNLCGPFGIKHDYKLKDIVELYLLILRNKDKINQEFVNSLKEKNYYYCLSCMVDIFKEFFSEKALEVLPQTVLTIESPKYNYDHVKWVLPISERLFDEYKREEEHLIYRYNNYTNKNRGKSIFLKNRKTFCSIPVRYSYYLDIFPSKFDYIVELYDDEIVFRYIICKEMCNIKLSQQIAMPSLSGKEIYKEISFILIDNKYIVEHNFDKIKFFINENESSYDVIFKYSREEIVFKSENSFFSSINVDAYLNERQVFNIYSDGDEYLMTGYYF